MSEYQRDKLEQYLIREAANSKGKLWGRSSIAKGWKAYFAGQEESDCPYKDTRTLDGRVSFSRAYRKAWLQGYNAAKLLD